MSTPVIWWTSIGTFMKSVDVCAEDGQGDLPRMDDTVDGLHFLTTEGGHGARRIARLRHVAER